MPGQTIVPSAVGVMSTSLPSLELLIKAILSTEPWQRDPDVVPIPWRESEIVKRNTKLCFASLSFDGIMQPHPPVQRGMRLVTQALKNAGHKVLTTISPPQQPLFSTRLTRVFRSSLGNRPATRLAVISTYCCETIPYDRADAFNTRIELIHP